MKKLRVDANLSYLYTGEQKKLGTPGKQDGKVDSHDLSRLNLVKVIKPGISLYTLVVGSCCLNDQVSLACISEVQANSKMKKALLFSTDIHLPREQIVEDDRARFIRQTIANSPQGDNDNLDMRKEVFEYLFVAPALARWGSTLKR